jgi:Family of unknown function (DUF5762)
MTTPFWTSDPSILLNKNSIFELWPTSSMNYNQKLNAITRLIFLLTILGFAVTMSVKLLFVGIATIAAIFILYKMQKQKLTKQILTEGFSDKNAENAMYIGGNPTPVTLESALKNEFKMGNKKNPFSNVLLTEIGDDPERKSAPPSFNPEVDEDIVRSTKKMVQNLNPGIKNTNKQLFGDLYNNFELDQSNRLFYSTANTKVANDQGAFAQYLYSDLKYSGKESTPEGAIARVQDNYRYTLY